MKCPGQDSRFWDENAIFEVKCPECGHEVEFFRDETRRKCRHCGHRVTNPKMDFGCASYCKFAAQCVGELPPELAAQRQELLKDRVAVEMKRYFKQDFRRIGHAGKVARYAEQIVKEERRDTAVVLMAAYLPDICIKEAERKYNSTGARHQEQEGPPIAREILTRLGAGEKVIEEVCGIIGHHHHPRAVETTNFKCLYDADTLVNLEEDLRKEPALLQKAAALVESRFLTPTGKRIAGEVLSRLRTDP